MAPRKLLIAALVVAIIVAAAVLFRQKGGCLSTSNCATGMTCQRMLCVGVPKPPVPPMPSKCTSDISCGPGKLCVNGACIDKSPAAIKPRQTQIRDCGWQDHLYGWFDAQGQGVKNDYCRFVGNIDDKNFSCAIAGAGGEYSAKPYNAAALAPGCDPSAGSGCGGNGCGLPM